jgi:hypothetical protein
MQIRDRIILLDDLLLLNQEARISEDEVGGLATFLADLPATERDTVLTYIHEEVDHFPRFARFARIANMPRKERTKMLQAVGLFFRIRSPLDDFFAFLGGEDAPRKVREVAGEVAMEAGRELQLSFFENLRRMLHNNRPIERQRDTRPGR